jgi:hypothetical protein
MTHGIEADIRATFGTNLIPSLDALEMGVAFNPATANFSRIHSPSELFISSAPIEPPGVFLEPPRVIPPRAAPGESMHRLTLLSLHFFHVSRLSLDLFEQLPVADRAALLVFLSRL